MGQHYKQLDSQDRIFLRVMLEKRYSQSKIAGILGVHRTTIYREVKRNSCIHHYSQKRFYDSLLAQKKSIKRRAREAKLDKDSQLREYVFTKLKAGWSPWQIEGRLRRENKGHCVISHEPIYRYIYANYQIRNEFYTCLRRQHFWRVKRGQRKPRIPQDQLITARPQEVADRQVFGHWEGDLMVFRQGIKENLITLRERKTRFLIAIKNASRQAKSTATNFISTLIKIKDCIQSITLDQGSEFAYHKLISECLNANIYFCKPASPQQKGGIENGNGVIRVHLPRSLDIGMRNQKQIDRLITEINNRPLKCLGYLSAAEAFLNETRNQRNKT